MTTVLPFVAGYLALAAGALWWASRRASGRATEVILVAILALPLLAAIAFVALALLFEDLR